MTEWDKGVAADRIKFDEGGDILNASEISAIWTNEYEKSLAEAEKQTDADTKQNMIDTATTRYNTNLVNLDKYQKARKATKDYVSGGDLWQQTNDYKYDLM
jgi:hypothetical protein